MSWNVSAIGWKKAIWPLIPGTIVNLAMTAVAFLPMFIKRLVYNVRVKHQQPAGKPHR